MAFSVEMHHTALPYQWFPPFFQTLSLALYLIRNRHTTFFLYSLESRLLLMLMNGSGLFYRVHDARVDLTSSQEQWKAPDLWKLYTNNQSTSQQRNCITLIDLPDTI